MELFPFSSVRPGQKQMVNAIKNTIESSKILLVHAPTGIGKTAASLAPSLEYALKNDKVVVFLTPRHTQHKIVVDTVRRINRKAGINVKIADIIGKKWLCGLEGIDYLSSSEFNEYCRALRKDESCEFYNNTWKRHGGLTKKAESIIKRMRSDVLNAEEIKDMCKDLCPYEIMMQVAKNSNVIIGDYFHFFHPGIRKTFLGRCGLKLEDVVLIIDEAHNLPARIRALLSSSISTLQLKRAEGEADSFGYNDVAEFFSRFRKSLKKELKAVLEKKASPEAFVRKSLLVDLLKNEVGEMDDFLEELEEIADDIREDRKKSYIGGFVSFMRMWLEDGGEFVRLARMKTSKSGRKIISLYRYCLDPSVVSRELFNEIHSAILMSGTLLPLEMYRDVLGIPSEKSTTLKLKSHFPIENRLEVVVDTVTTQYTKRDEKNFVEIAKQLISIINSSPPNICVFFPSYELRDTILNMIEFSLEKEVIVEVKGMSKAEKALLLEKFMRAVNNGGACLLGVIGGSFDQGIDFPNNIVKCVVIVGLPLEKPDLVTEAMINYYEAKFKKGWDYAYIYPAVIKAQQAAGRAIRSEKDRAVIVYMDRRYLWANYRKCFPPESKFVCSREPDKIITKFFEVQ